MTACVIIVMQTFDCNMPCVLCVCIESVGEESG